MTINVLWIILASAIGLGMGQSIEPSTATAQDDSIYHKAVDECYINGTWYNPCPIDPAPDPPPSDPPPDPNPQ